MLDLEILKRVRTEGTEWAEPPVVGQRVGLRSLENPNTYSILGRVVHVEPDLARSHVVRWDDGVMGICHGDELMRVEEDEEGDH